MYSPNGPIDVINCPNELHRFWYLLTLAQSEILTLKESLTELRTQHENHKNLVREYSRSHKTIKHTKV